MWRYTPRRIFHSKALPCFLPNKTDNQETQNEVTVLYHFPALRYWISAEQKIKQVSNITNIQVQAMTPGKAQFKISYTGSLDALQKQLNNIGYNLENADTHMTLSDIGE